MFDDTELSELMRNLKQSLDGVFPQEFNELDWKGALSQKSERLKEHLSAFSNYNGGGYLIFGIADNANIDGVSQANAKVIMQKLGSIAREGLEPAISLKFHSFLYKDQTLLAVRVPESLEKPVRKRGAPLEQSYIRAGGETRKMTNHELRIALIGSRSLRFEELPAAVSPEIVSDIPKYFDFSDIHRRLGRRPGSDDRMDKDFLHSHKLVTRSGNQFIPTNLGVLCAAKDLNNMSGYERYGIRITQYKGRTKLGIRDDMFFYEGYSHSLDKIIGHIVKLLPYSEIIKRATRVEVPIIPEAALREIVVNAIVHRDYSKTGSYITIDIYDDRVEVTNPGTLLPNIKVDRLIDHPSQTRNEVLADFMRKLKFCEEQGSGIDKAVSAMEFYGLPPLKFSPSVDYFAVTLFAPKAFSEMEKEERIDAVYQHSCLNYVASKRTTNASVRQRFHFDDRQSTKVTRLLNDAVDAGRIKLANPAASPRDMHYLPYWARSTSKD